MKEVRNSDCKRRPSGFQFAVASRIELLNSDHWDSVTADASIFLKRQFLCATQEEFTGKLLRDFAIVYDQGRPVAAVATQTFDVHGDQLLGRADSGHRFFPSEWKQKSLSLLKHRIMMCGNVHTWGPHGVAIGRNENQQRVWHGIADCLYRIRRANRLFGQCDYVIVKDLFEQEQISASALKSFSYEPLETEPNMVLTLDPQWQSMDDYLASLSARYRAAAKKVRKPFEGNLLTLSPIDNVLNEADRIWELYNGVASKAKVCLFTLSVTTLPRIAQACGGHFVTIGIYEHEKLIGFVTVIRDGDTAIGFYLGFDYEANARLPIYHALLLAVIEQAISWRCKAVSFGRTALEAKSRLGCQPEKSYVWIRHRVPVVNFVVQQLLRNVTHEEPPQRNPFKEA